MRALADNAVAGLRAFLDQRDDLVLVLDAADGDLPAALKIIEGLDAELPWLWGWVFAQSFANAASYAETIVRDIVAKRAAMSAALERQGKPPLRAPPDALLDAAREPADRLRAAVVYVRSLAPRAPGGVTLFALAPLEIADPAGYAGLASELVRHQMPFPWCAGVRFVLRDDRARPALLPLATAPRARSLRVDFGPDALAAALVQEAADKALPVERRMNATLVAAGMDQAHGRSADAMARYATALRHYGETGNAPLAALAANGIAACKQAQGDIAGAERILHAALETGLQANPPALPVVLNILLDLTMLVARQGRWAEAELFLTATDGVASVLLMPSVRAEALVRRGIAQARLGKAQEAERSWREAAEIADAADEPGHALAARTHLQKLLRQAGRTAEAHQIARLIERSDDRGAAA
jgi:tetratricopeptide (TPR) repeat protein